MDEETAVSTFGPYRLEARIGRGGMGVVYRGRHVGTGEAVAVKTIRVRSADRIAAFRREVQVLADLEHPGIVRVLDQGLTDGMPWYAMELVEGRPLSRLLHGAQPDLTQRVAGRWAATAPISEGEVLGRGIDTAPLLEEDATPPSVEPADSVADGYLNRPSLTELLQVVRKVCSALGFVHSHGLVHRDVKPENILIQASGNPVLVDFGVVGQFGDRTGREVLELAGWAGTRAYMAPEQALGSLVDARADLFSLGCILYECIVGETPFGRGGLHESTLSPPPAPSTRVASLSAELDALVMRLLARDLRDRLGYAEDVALALDRILRGSEAIRTGSGEPVYLYRPDFAGRRELLDRLSTQLHDAKRGAGSFTLVSGESGLGKTRLLLELGAVAVAAGMTVITGESPPVAVVASDEGARGKPLHPFRNLLLTVADACRAGGPELAERLLAERGSVLARFEPSLADVLGGTPLAPERESPERARERVFTALEGLLSAFSQERPLLLLLDDLQWADSLSLELLSRLAGHPQARQHICLVASFRSEEINDELRALSDVPSVQKERLERFDAQAVGQMVSDMLALRDPPAEWIAFLEQESEGNPFFIAEYLRAAIAERLLTRTANGHWTLGDVGDGSSLRERLGLPATIGALVSRRLGGLDTDSLTTVRAAAVLGRELDPELVAHVAELAPERVSASFTLLRRRQVLEDKTSGGSCFVHDKLREVAYDMIAVQERPSLHRRAAEALTGRQQSGAGAVDPGMLGHHHAQSGDHERAASFFEQAGDAARRNFATRDALRFFRLALGELERAEPKDFLAGARVREAIADLSFLFGDVEEARIMLERALADTPISDGIARARRWRLQARTRERLHQHERALSLCARAEQELGEPPAATARAEEYWFEWVQIQIQITGHLYFLNRVAELQALLERVRPVIEKRGSAQQRFQFLHGLLHAELRRERYRSSPATMTLARATLAAAEQTGDATEIAIGRSNVAGAITFTGAAEVDEGEAMFRAALAHFERVGDASMHTRFLAYYGLLLRRAQRTEAASAVALQTLESAEKYGFFDYVGVAQGNLAWVALERGGDVEAAAGQALQAWQRLPGGYIYPLQWCARMPLAVHLARAGKLDEALDQWHLLLDPRQHLLPDPLSAAIEAALEQRGAGPDAVSARLQTVAELARALRYL